MKYTASVGKQKDIMQYHRDSPQEDGKPVFTVVFTIKSADCIGGNIRISNRDDGTVRHSANSSVYIADNNSAYAMFGSHITHSVMGVQAGYRYAFVIFHTSERSDRLYNVGLIGAKESIFVTCVVKHIAAEVHC